MSKMEKTKGSMKEAAGGLVGNDDLEREGEAQQERGEHMDDAGDAREDAKEHENKARKSESEQRANQ